MSIDRIPAEIRRQDYYQHIDPGFLNRRRCLSDLPPDVREDHSGRLQFGNDPYSLLHNDHRLVTAILDLCDSRDTPTLLKALEHGKFPQMFRSTERLEPCPEIDTADRVRHGVVLDLVFEKPVVIAYHTQHVVSDTGKMTLKEGVTGNYVHSIVGFLHDRGDRFEIEPLVMGAPTVNHPRNGGSEAEEQVIVARTPTHRGIERNDGCLFWLPWIGRDHGEILPEDIEQFAKMAEVSVSSAEEWMSVMEKLPEAKVKAAFASLLGEPTKKDWGGESNDHFSGNLTLGGRRQTAAFLLKGPTTFREMTLEMCGKRADQIHRLTESGADVSVVQHAHLVGNYVRKTLRHLTVYPGMHRKYCVIDGQHTYRILKAYGLLN